MYTNKKGKKILFDSGSEEEEDDILGTNSKLVKDFSWKALYEFFQITMAYFKSKIKGHVLETPI